MRDVGPLSGLKIIEMASIGPVPFCGLLLSNLGATVLRIERPGPVDLGLGVEIEDRFDLLNIGKSQIAIDLKTDRGKAAIALLVRGADALIEGFRPGVMEKLGLDPAACHAANPKLIYGRLTGWGQSGSQSTMAGHDINFIAEAGALAAVGETSGPPVVPLNLIGDFGGGSLFLAMGVLAALLETRKTGMGQVVDAAMVDGVANLMAMHHGLQQSGYWDLDRGSNAVDGGAPYYTAYRTADGRFVAVGAIEDRFYGEMLSILDIEVDTLPDRHDRSQWPRLRARLSEIFARRTMAEWQDKFHGSDACVSPVLTMNEARTSRLARERSIFRDVDAVSCPVPAPRIRPAGEPERNETKDPLSSPFVWADWGIDPANSDLFA